VHWETWEAATDYEAPPERKWSEPGRRSGAAVVSEPAAPAPAAAELAVTHPVFVGSAVKGPVSAGSAAPVHFFGGSAACSGTLRQRQAADGRQIQEAGRRWSH
jgi:hypothetical protein